MADVLSDLNSLRRMVEEQAQRRREEIAVAQALYAESQTWLATLQDLIKAAEGPIAYYEERRDG